MGGCPPGKDRDVGSYANDEDWDSLVMTPRVMKAGMAGCLSTWLTMATVGGYVGRCR